MIKKPVDLIREARSGTFCLTAEGARQQKLDDPSTMIIDVREPEEVAASSITGAVNIPRGLLEMKIEQVVPRHDAAIMVCCATGGRAALAAQTLKQMGYSNVKLIDVPHQEIAEAFS